MINNYYKVREFYQVLYRHFGEQNWWPADSRFECIIGTILTQNTSWENAYRAVTNLKSSMELTVENLNYITTDRLSELIRPAGYFNVKAARIKNLVHLITEEFSGDIDRMFELETRSLREKLLEVKGIGPETADSILLYAGDRPVFVVDSYTHRVLSRHRMIPEDATYSEIQELFMNSLEEDSAVFNEYHALIVKLAKEHCRKNPLCDQCPLEYDLLDKGIR